MSFDLHGLKLSDSTSDYLSSPCYTSPHIPTPCPLSLTPSSQHTTPPRLRHQQQLTPNPTLHLLTPQPHLPHTLPHLRNRRPHRPPIPQNQQHQPIVKNTHNMLARHPVPIPHLRVPRH